MSTIRDFDDVVQVPEWVPLDVAADWGQREESGLVWTTSRDLIVAEDVRLGQVLVAGRGQRRWLATVALIKKDRQPNVILLAPLPWWSLPHDPIDEYALNAAGVQAAGSTQDVASADSSGSALRDRPKRSHAEVQLSGALHDLRIVARQAILRVTAEALLDHPDAAFLSPQWMHLLRLVQVDAMRGSGRVAREELQRDLVMLRRDADGSGTCS